MTQTTEALPGHDCRFVAARDAVEALVPGAFDRLPYTSRVFAENLVRKTKSDELAQGLEQVVHGRADADFAFSPARVVLQDLLGTPALVDLAGLRDAVAESGGDPARVNPVVPTQLVVDHSLNVEVGGMVGDAMRRNMEIEQRKNAERFEFLAWARRAFRNVDIVMPGNGILHQINLERLSPVVQVKDGVAFVDTLVGTDSHTTMINALGVLGWGVGGIEAESVMLGRPIWMRLPTIVGVELTGTRQPGVQATDLVLALTEYLRAQGVVGTILEFHGEGARRLSLADRATISNMAPEFGATAAMFAIDERTLEFLRLTGRRPAQVRLVEAYAKAQGLWADGLESAEYQRSLRFDLSEVGRAIAGPANPHQRIPLTQLKAAGIATTRAERDAAIDAEWAGKPLPEGAVVIAAITSCTNTSNPRNVLAAGLLARKAVAAGLQRKPWVKTSFAPGSKAVERYLEAADLLAPLQQLGFGIVGFGCTTCNGMSGPLPEAIEQEILDRDLHTVAVLSGNRNFNGRIHPRVKEAFLASPALTVAYAIAGTIRIDIENEPLATRDRTPIRLADLWPTDEEIDAALAQHVRGDQFSSVYDEMFTAGDVDASTGKVPARFPWREDSTYIRRPPYWQEDLTTPPRGKDMRAIVVLGDNTTTDDLSPSGAILPESASGQYLMAHGVAPSEFNSYGTRRGDHIVAVRATFANNRLSNEMTPGVEGSFTRLEPEGKVMPLFDAAQHYLERGQELVVIAGNNYGCGSSRDWAAKGVRLLGVRTVICESFERIHRTNLVGMGVLPLQFEPGITRKTLGIDGSETFTIEGLNGAPAPRGTLVLAIRRRDGSTVRTPVTCRIDTTEERQIFEAGGLLPRIGNELRRTALVSK
ncbi:MAG TPA: aconitate hydratase AcnA [Burkholderiaceae bacterium]|nr:aconitate hydratase AcnA [Burkholderiaceae bacterium]